MKDVGLVGLPYSGKSTLFTALTHAGAAGGRANQAVVPVPDPRIDVLAELERSRKRVHAQVRFTDVPGGTGAQAMAALREADALCVVVRAFGPDRHPAADLAEVGAELILADLAVVESALEGARKRMKGPAAKEAAHEVGDARAGAGGAVGGTSAAGGGPRRGGRRVLARDRAADAQADGGRGEPRGGRGGPAPTCPTARSASGRRSKPRRPGMPEDDARALLEEFGVHEPGLGVGGGGVATARST